ncbi:MAG: phosphate/phosphite/phosphonate ABC transporter substrate-binding protein [Candidatus Schekmanbacteria bacterium]|nr:phosphate/phosphite/phosphonate ABC transporter substrate-binding protein [Candidatus Schekmanbacteria bacterium]
MVKISGHLVGEKTTNLFILRLFFVFVIPFFLLISACEEKLIETQEHRIIPGAKKENKPIVKFGVISRYNPVLMYKRYQPIMDYLTENTPYKFELKLGSTYEETVEDLHYGETEVASLGGVTFVESWIAFGAKAILRSKNVSGKGFYYSDIVTREDSGINKLSDLKGKTFAFASIKSTSGNLFPRYLLWHNGIGLEDIKYVNLKHHDAVATGVLKGKYAAGALKDVEAEKYSRMGLKVISRSDPIPSVPIVVRSNADPEMVSWIKKALLKVNPVNTRDRNIVKDWDEEFKFGFMEARNSDYEIIRKMIEDIPVSCGGTCHPKNIFKNGARRIGKMDKSQD